MNNSPNVIVIDKLLILKLKEKKYKKFNLRIAIPSSNIKEIKETDDENICIVNGYEIVIGFDELISKCRRFFEW